MAIDAATLQARLTEAETARHRLAVGQLPEYTVVDGEGAVRYTPADLNKLDGYIASLKSDLSGTTQGTAANRRRPIRLGF